jgi:hypothetical protein
VARTGNTNGQLASTHLADLRAIPHRSLIKQMRPKELSNIADTIRSTIPMQAATPLKVEKKAKELPTPLRVDFGRKKPSVALPKLGGTKTSSVVKGIVTTNTGRPIEAQEEEETDKRPGLLSQDGEIVGNATMKKSKQNKAPVRRSRRIENKEN